MNRTFINSYKVSFAEGGNAFIYRLKRIPVIGKKIPESLYKETQLKITFGILHEILGVFGTFLGKAFYFGILLILPCYLMTNGIHNIVPQFLHMFFFLNFILGSLMGVVIINERNEKAFDMIILMKSNPKEYYTGEIVYKGISNFIYFAISLIVIGLIIGFSPLKAVILAAELIAFKFMGEFLHLFVYHKTGKNLSNSTAVVLSMIAAGLAAAYALPALGFTIGFNYILFNIFFILSSIALGAAAFIYIITYKDYVITAKKILSNDHIFNKQAFASDAEFGSVKINETKMKLENLNTNKYDNKHGYDYLNSLFFLRFKRVLVRPVQIRVAIICIAFVAAVFTIIFVPSQKSVVINAVMRNTPIYVFVMYMLSTGERICKAMFYNCDASLLRYAYYRQGKVILHNFSIRLRMAVLLNVIPALVLCAALAGVITAGGMYTKLISMIPVFLCIICLSCFFCIHHLFMYYVIQPYTSQLTEKSPLFKFINMIIYIISYACLQIKTSSSYFTLGVTAATVIYIALALLMIYKKAPKTFKLK